MGERKRDGQVARATERWIARRGPIACWLERAAVIRRAALQSDRQAGLWVGRFENAHIHRET